MLADLEQETVALAEGLRRGELLAPVTPWHPPVLPPIPAELVARAQALLDQQLRLQIQIGLELELDRPPPSRARPASQPDPAPQLVDLAGVTVGHRRFRASAWFCPVPAGSNTFLTKS